ncbi:MAG: hypothetical protein ACWGSD_11330, partial [Thermodesulfobacteriota bacterium]
PQIIGHEVVASFEGQPVVVEINASHTARGLVASHCPQCLAGVPSQCPDRLTLGINRLPGGFSPHMLAPVKGLIPVPAGLSVRAAVFAEPFAAALHAVETTPPQEGEHVAVVGPRRLGLLLVGALDRFRMKTGRRFHLTAVVRHPRLSVLCRELGADRVVDVSDGGASALQRRFETVYDTSGTPEGFSLSLFLAGKRVHLKSTHGRPVLGVSRLTDMVVAEIRLASYPDFFSQQRKAPAVRTDPGGASVYLSDSVPERVRHEMEKHGHVRTTSGGTPGSASEPRAQSEEVDGAVVTTLHEADALLEGSGASGVRLRPRGTILYAGPARGGRPGLLEEALARGVEIHTSRCGSLSRGMAMLSEDSELSHLFENRLITHTFPLDRIEEAFRMAADSRASIKVLVATGT